MKPSDNVYQFKVTLKGIRPPIWRRMHVPENYTFWDLHVAIQDAMGWFDYHLHEFLIVNPSTGQKERIGILLEDTGFDEEPIPGWERKIIRYFSMENPKAEYIYDFGDSWEHSITLEKILSRKRDTQYPVCIKGKRACPPEDCGGVWGYTNLLEILSDPENEEYEEWKEWLGEDFDPEHFDAKAVHFDDPKKRWNYAFGDEVDLSQGPVTASAQEIPPELRAFQRERMHELWEKAKNNDLEDLDPEERHIAGIMLDHQDEFFNQFEYADLTHDHEYDPDSEVNPFLHIYIHSAIETQLENKDPIEAFQFYNAMRNKKCSHHDVLHLIGAVFAPLMFNVLKNKRPFDLDTYIYLLKKYKTRKPEKLMDLLDNEPLLVDFSP